MVTFNPREGHAVLINTFHVKPGKAEALVMLLSMATEKTVQHLKGFVSANLHVSMDGKTVVNYAQWRSKEDFEAAMKAPAFVAHTREVKSLIESFEPVLYELRYSHTAPEP